MPTVTRRVVVVSCGGKKCDRPVAPAGEMYVGRYHLACREAAATLTADGGLVLILSSKYGLLRLTRMIAQYDMQPDSPKAVTPEKLRRQARRLGILDADVTVLGGRQYVELTREVWPGAHAPLKGGIGQQLQQLAGMSGKPPQADGAVS